MRFAPPPRLASPALAAALLAAALPGPARAEDGARAWPDVGEDPVAASTSAPGAASAPAPPPATEPTAAPSTVLSLAPAQEEEPAHPTLSVELGAYYSNVGLYVPLTRDPIPNVGEKSELDLYWALLPRSFPPRFLVLEASVNPMPCLGVLARKQATREYEASEVYPGMNLVRAVTAGFEEPWAVSAFIGNVVDFDVPGRTDVDGKGYFGGVVSAGNWQIKDNVLVDDDWLEIESKLKGDRRAPDKKLSWSFRVGTKLHSNHDIVNAWYFAIRRSRVDYGGGDLLVANSGIEWRIDLGYDGAVQRQILLVDKKWPLRSTAFSLGIGLLWDRGTEYRGALATPLPRALQFLLRPNVEF